MLKLSFRFHKVSNVEQGRRSYSSIHSDMTCAQIFQQGSIYKGMCSCVVGLS